MLSEEVLANASALQRYLNSFGPSCEPLFYFPSNRDGYYNFMFSVSSAEDSTCINFSDCRLDGGGGYVTRIAKRESNYEERSEKVLVKEKLKPQCAQPHEMAAYKIMIEELTPLGIFVEPPTSKYFPDYGRPFNEVDSDTSMSFDFSKPGLAAQLDSLAQKRSNAPSFAQSGDHSLVNILKFRDQTYIDERARETHKEDGDQLSFEIIEKSLMAEKFKQPASYGAIVRGPRLEASLPRR